MARRHVSRKAPANSNYKLGHSSAGRAASTPQHLFWMMVTIRGKARCLLYNKGFGPCEGRIEAHHVVPKSRIKVHYGRDAQRAQKAVWDPRNGVPLCQQHHHLVTIRKIKLPWQRIPEKVFLFAADHGLDWSLDRDLEGGDEWRNTWLT